jgi:hypothetical protein
VEVAAVKERSPAGANRRPRARLCREGTNVADENAIQVPSGDQTGPDESFAGSVIANEVVSSASSTTIELWQGGLPPQSSGRA